MYIENWPHGLDYLELGKVQNVLDLLTSSHLFIYIFRHILQSCKSCVVALGVLIGGGPSWGNFPFTLFPCGNFSLVETVWKLSN